MLRELISRISKQMGKLNGWQRAWVVLAIIWALLCTWGASGYWPERPEARRDTDFADSIIARQLSLSNEKGNDNKTLLARWLAQNLPPLNNRDDVRIATEKAKNGKGIDPHVLLGEGESKKILSEYEANRQSYRSRVESTIESGLAWWGIPMTCIYLFGLAIAWVHAGFRQPSS